MGLGFVVVSAIALLADRSAQPWEVLLTGDSVRVVGFFVNRSVRAAPYMSLIYQTRADSSDHLRLDREARALWPRLRKVTEDDGLIWASIAAEMPPTGLCIHRMGICKFVRINTVEGRGSDGLWRWTRDWSIIPAVP